MGEYDNLAKYYFERRKDKTRFDYNRDIEVPALLNLLGDIKNKRVLDLGCGFGDHALKLSKFNFKELIGLDISKELINFAKEMNIPKTTFNVWDLNNKLKFKNAYFDIVYSSLVIHYLKNLDVFFKEVNRVLKKGGIFCFSTGHPIFNLLNQVPESIIGITKFDDGKKKIYGNYFDEGFKLNNLGGIGKLKLKSYTFETLIKTGLKSGFELIDYVDAKPVKDSKKYNSEKFKLTNTLPTFILFKFKKK